MERNRPGPAPSIKSKEKCIKEGCKRRRYIDRSYCSRECAPFGTWRDHESQVQESLEKLKKLEEEYKDFDEQGMRILK